MCPFIPIQMHQMNLTSFTVTPPLQGYVSPAQSTLVLKLIIKTPLVFLYKVKKVLAWSCPGPSTNICSQMSYFAFWIKLLQSVFLLKKLFKWKKMGMRGVRGRWGGKGGTVAVRLVIIGHSMELEWNMMNLTVLVGHNYY